MRKRSVSLGIFVLTFIFIATHCFAALVDPRKPRKTGASIYKKRGEASRPASRYTPPPEPAMNEQMNTEGTGDSRNNRMPENTRRSNR